MAFVSSGTGEVLTHIQAGTVRALAITSATRRGGPLKDIPTLKELGINTTYEVWRGIFGTPGMSKDAQAWWANTIKKMVGTKTWKDSLEKLQWADAYDGREGVCEVPRRGRRSLIPGADDGSRFCEIGAFFHQGSGIGVFPRPGPGTSGSHGHEGNEEKDTMTASRVLF